MPTCCMLCVPSFALLVSNKAQLKNYLDIYEAQRPLIFIVLLFWHLIPSL